MFDSRPIRVRFGSTGCVALVAIVLAVQAAAARQTPAAAGSIQFENVSASSGLTFVLDQHATPEKNMVETMAGGVAVFDYDGDGLPDLYFTNGGSIPSLRKESPGEWNRLFHNDGGLKFTDVTERAGVKAEGYTTGAAAADFDNDGRVDLFVAGVQRNQLFRNSGRWPVRGHHCEGRDQELHLVGRGRVVRLRQRRLARSLRRQLRGLDARGQQVLRRPRARICASTAIRGSTRACRTRCYRNRHDGTFEDVSETSGIAAHIGKGMSVAFADYDGDGFTDVFVTNDAIPDFLFRNRGNGTFEEVGLLAGVAVPAHGRPISSMGVDFRDYDNDGRPDLNVTALTGETFPLFKNENGSFFRDVTYASGLGAGSIRMSGWGNALADFDNDGFKDLVTANSHANDRIEEFESATYRQRNAVFRNVERQVPGRLGPGGCRLRRGAGKPGHRRWRFRQRWPARRRRHACSASSRCCCTT